MKFSRKLSGLLGVISFAIMAVAAVTVLIVLRMPPAVVWGGCGLFGPASAVKGYFCNPGVRETLPGLLHL